MEDHRDKAIRIFHDARGEPRLVFSVSRSRCLSLPGGGGRTGGGGGGETERERKRRGTFADVRDAG